MSYPSFGRKPPDASGCFLTSAQEADERALNEFIAKARVRRIVPALIQDVVPKFWSIYVEYEVTKKELESKEEGKVISRSYNLESIRRRYPRAYEKWTEGDDVRLRIEDGSGVGVQTLSQMFQRQPSAIRSRLRKLGLVKWWLVRNDVPLRHLLGLCKRCGGKGWDFRHAERQFVVTGGIKRVSQELATYVCAKT